MTEWSIERVADTLLEAERTRTDRGRITDEWPDLDLEKAYEAQDALIAKKIAAGDRLIGVKLGLTSRAKQQRMGIDSPLVAQLTEGMVLPLDTPVPLDTLIHPRVEPEIVFVMGAELAGPGVTAVSALAAVESVHAGFEVIDSRFTDFSFALPDVVADNASSSYFVVGALAIPPAALDLELEAVALSVDGAVVDTATGAAVQGHPAQALALAANELAKRGRSIPRGAIVLAGGMTDAVPIHRGSTVTAEFTSLGLLSLTAE